MQAVLLPEKVISLRNEIFEDIYRNSEWIYVKLQSLFQTVGCVFLENNLWEGEFSSEESTGSEIFRHIIRSRFFQSKAKLNIEKQFYDLNEKANLIKHNSDPDRLEKTDFDIGFVKACFRAYNQYVYELFDKDWRSFELDLSIFDDTVVATVSSVTETNDLKSAEYFSKDYEIESERVIVSHEKTKRTFPLANRMYKFYCGAGRQDYGFVVHGIPEVRTCQIKEASLYAIVFGFLQRNINVKKDYLVEQWEARYGRQLNLSVIFRYQMILLLMIRANFAEESKIRVYPTDGMEPELRVAIESITSYTQKLATLTGVDSSSVSIIVSEKGFRISATSNVYANIYVVDFESRSDETAREIWFERPVKYSVSRSDPHRKIIEYFMFDFFGYSSFKPGQFEALIHMMNSSVNSLCIMPTGGGKSMLYYFLALLQPGSSLIISPTGILIEDQIRNMQLLHQIDDVQIIQDEDLYQKGKFSILHKFIFLTPSDFQHVSMIYKIIELNTSRKISAIMLDEVHTISNWSHDFRPDYLMLSFNLLTFADHPRMYGFTATANFRVVNDIKYQLALEDNAIVLPVELKRTDISFDYIPTKHETEFSDIFREEVEKIAYGSKRDKDKMIAFTKNEKQSRKLVDSIDDACKYHIDVFHSDVADSYLGFINGRKSVLVADAGMGIGINMPDVYHVMHIGLPISKAQYVQEIGRSSRFGQGATSSVVFKSKRNMSDYERRALNFNTSIDEVLSLIALMRDDNEENDIAYACSSILGHLENYTSAATHINEIYEELLNVENETKLNIAVNNQDEKSIRRHQVYLYFLHKMGIIYNWYIVRKNSDSIDYSIEVEHNHHRLEAVRQRSIEYISRLSPTPNKRTVYLIEQAKDIKTIILLVQKWYYDEFLYYHREQLLNILDFLEINESGNVTNEEITSQLAGYFAVATFSNSQDEIQLFSALSIRELMEKSIENQDVSLISRIEHHLENQYQSKLDLFSFFNQFYTHKYFNQSRLERIVNRIEKVLWFELLENLFVLYGDCSDAEKLSMFNILSQRIKEDQLLEKIYEKNPLDMIYYAYYAKTVNQRLINQ